MSDIIKIASIPGLEPEEQPLAREVDAQIDVRGSRDGSMLGQMNSQVQSVSTAGEFANNLKRVCTNCKHFDVPKAQEVFAESSKSPDGRKELNNLRANLIVMSGAPIGDDGQADTDYALSCMGVCRAISEITKSDMIVHPLGFCPVETYGDNFKPVDRAAAKRGEAARDGILLRADGRIP